jgi:hypothetical protein
MILPAGFPDVPSGRPHSRIAEDLEPEKVLSLGISLLVVRVRADVCHGLPLDHMLLPGTSPARKSAHGRHGMPSMRRASGPRCRRMGHASG